jgi:signal transduction histidine kinase
MALPPPIAPDMTRDEHDVLAWVARVITAVRAMVVTSVLCLVLVGPPWVRLHVPAALITLSVAALYAILLLFKPGLEIRRTRWALVVTAMDASITLAMIAVTGGLSSPAVSILPLVVIVAATRSRTVIAFMLTALISASYAAFLLFFARDSQGELDPVLQAIWWPMYLTFAAILAVALSVAAEREQHARLLARVEVEQSQAAADEERDLRARLLQSYQSQQDGLRVLLHEFRTPLASLTALSEALVDDGSPMSRGDRAESLRLANAHVHHLNDMLDALGDVALSWRPAFNTGRVRDTDLEELILAAADAVGLRRPRLGVRVASEATTVQVDVQGLRRVLTNLLENASRHGRGKPIDVTCSLRGRELCVSVLDRGPGLPPGSLGELTAKFVSVGERRGTAGLGLWIVQQILEATGGRLYFADRPGGGLVATFHLPLSQATPAG